MKRFVLFGICLCLLTLSCKAQNKNNDIVGVWQGNYNEGGGTGGKGTLTLTIYDDMNGVIEFVINRKSEQLEGSYTVSVNNSKGKYNVTGKEFIRKPNNYGFDNFSGAISNDVFRGKNFQFKKIVTAEKLREQQAERERQLQEQQTEQARQLKAQEAKAKRQETVMTVITSIVIGGLFLLFLKLPKEKQGAILKTVGVVFIVIIAIMKIFSNTWDRDHKN